jgi:hypothetical protein
MESILSEYKLVIKTLGGDLGAYLCAFQAMKLQCSCNLGTIKSHGHAVVKGCIVETRGSISPIPLQVCTMQIGSCMF